jgi:predicted negative regulator of RcsB-dependent stress response
VKLPTKKMKKTSKQVNSRKHFIRYGVIVIAIIVIVFLGIAGYNYFTLSAQEVFSDNYHSYVLDTIPGSNGSESIIEKEYRKKQYHEVSIITLPSPFTNEEVFLRGLSFLETGDIRSAVLELQKIVDNTDADDPVSIKETAEYYLALAYIDGKNYNAALELLRKIKKNSHHVYHEKVSSKLIWQVKLLRWR